jgi:hypothetical protein
MLLLSARDSKFEEGSGHIFIGTAIEEVVEKTRYRTPTANSKANPGLRGEVLM